MMRKLKKLCVSLLIALAVSIVPVMSVLGFDMPDPDRPVSLTMTLKSQGDEVRYASGAEITLYKVASCGISGGAVRYTLTGDYASSKISLEGKITQSMIDDLVKYTDEHGISGITKKTDNGGKIIFDGLENGVYLVSATSLPEGFTSFVPFMYFLPYFDEDTSEWVYDGVAEPKISYYPPVKVTVKKVWNDDGKSRPESVKIELSNEDGVYETVKLNSANNWRYEWTNMRADKKWSVKEIDVPADYKATYASSGFDFTVTNTSQLVQTGQVSWPVPVMVFAGAFLICAGILIKLPGKRKDEE